MALFKHLRTYVVAAAAALGVMSWHAAPAHAELSKGPGGQGVTVGKSSLIGTLDYSDTFTGADDGGSNPARIYQAAVQPPEAYPVENTHGNPQVSFVQQVQGAESVPNFSFAGGSTPGEKGLVQGNFVARWPGSSGATSDTGFTQTGGGVDYGINYGLRDEYVVQVDMVQVPERLDITSSPLPGSIFQSQSLSVFFRGPQWGGDPTHGNNISLYNGAVDTPLRGQPGFEEFSTGLSDAPQQWHNYAVRFDQKDQEIEVYIDEKSIALIDLETFAGGIYAGFSNGAVGAGAAPGAGNRLWTDNFQVGAPATVVPPDFLVADFNSDGRVDVADLGILATNYNESPPDPPGKAGGDANNDGRVDVADLGILATHYGQPRPAGQSFEQAAASFGNLPAVPEPAAVGVLALGALGLVARRRR